MATNLQPVSGDLTNLEESGLAAGATSTTSSVLNAGSGEYFDYVQVQIQVTFDSAPTANGDTVDLYAARSTDGGTSIDQDAGSKDVGQNFVGSICDDQDAATNSYTKTLIIGGFDYVELLIANNTDAAITVNDASYDGLKIVYTA